MSSDANDTTKEIGYIKERKIIDEMEESYINYAMSVIVSRALPDVRDGLKPVHRRILFTMHNMGLVHSAKFRKSATVVGDTMGKYHPHGDMAIYDSLVRMAQDFSLRYPLIKPQGNFGSIDNDPAAASRYTECKLSKIGEAMLKNIEKDTVDFRDNYDATRKEPIVLPSPLPQLLLNGSLGIAVGMATNIPPHNLSELIDAIVYLIDNPKADTPDLFKFVKGPDFPGAGIIFNQKQIIEAYSQGKGPIEVRGKVEVIEDKKQKSYILITEIPYQVQKSALVKHIATLAQDKKIIGIRDIRDESDRNGMRVVIELQRDAFPQKIINRLYKFTDLQKLFHLNMLALVDGIQPKVLSLKDVLAYYLEHKREVVVRKIKFNLEKAKQRAHILEGLHICLTDIDAVIRIIKKSKNREDAQINLMKKFKLSEIQATAILETKLAALAQMERAKIEDELKEKKRIIQELTAILKSPAKIKAVVKKELLEAKEAFGDKRRTKVVIQKIGEIAEEDLIPQEDAIITLTRGGYIKRINPSVYKIQKRGGKGIMGMKTVGDDIVEHFIPCQTHDALLFFTDSGKVFKVLAYEIPEGTRVAKGRGLLNFLDISQDDKILSILSLPRDFKKQDKKNKDIEIKYLAMATKNGVIKKTELQDFETVRKTGLIAIKLKKGDELRSVCESSGEDEIMLVTKNGQSVKFDEKEIRPMGRGSSGNRGIRLKKDDELVEMSVIKKQISDDKKKNYLLVIMENGYGKKTDIKEYRLQSRGGSGTKTANITTKTGSIKAAKLLDGEEEDLIVISEQGQIIRTSISSVPILSRSTQGVRIMRLNEKDKVVSVACM